MLTDNEKILLQVAEKMADTMQLFIDEVEAAEPDEARFCMQAEKMLLARFEGIKKELGQDWQSLLAGDDEPDEDQPDMFSSNKEERRLMI